LFSGHDERLQDSKETAAVLKTPHEQPLLKHVRAVWLLVIFIQHSLSALSHFQMPSLPTRKFIATSLLRLPHRGSVIAQSLTLQKLTKRCLLYKPYRHQSFVCFLFKGTRKLNNEEIHFTHHQISNSDQIRDEMGGPCSAHRENEEGIPNFGRTTWT
jgi:hypothetical protein